MNRPEQESPPSLVDSPLDATRPHRPPPSPVTRQLALQLGQMLYTHNPFYVASAWMIFSGLRASFSVNGGSFDAWALTLGLAGYTLLLSVTAFLVIRFGKVWDDARSLLLLIVLMFLGISVTFDGILADSPELGLRYYLLGWVFSATISELLLRSLRLRLGPLFRLPFHLLLALFFLYPLVLAPRLGNPDDPALAWELFGFSSVAALIFLSLLPAVRRGPAYLKSNGSPWPWPWFPWVLFGMLGFCVSLRAYYLCLSLHFVGYSNSIFGPYFLVPLGLAAALLLLEAGLVSGSARVVQRALYAPLGLVMLALVGHRSDAVYQNFLTLFQERFGATPLCVTLWIVAGFYLLAALRRVGEANHMLTGTLIALSLVLARSGWRDLLGLDPLPLALAGAWQIAIGLRLRRSADFVGGLCLWLLSVTLAGRGTWFDAWHGALPIHLLLIILLGAGYWYRDRAGRYARRGAITLALLLVAIAALGDHSLVGEVPAWAWTLYPFAMAALIIGYGYATGDRWCYAGAAAAMAVWFAVYAGRAYVHLQHRVFGLNQLAWGALFFLLAAVISLLKSGLHQRWLRRQPP